MRLLRTTARAALWAGAGGLTGVLAWSALAATLMPVLYPSGRGWEDVAGWPWAFLGSAYFAAFIGAAALPVYLMLFCGWLVARRRWPARGWLGDPGVAAVFLGTPLALALGWGFGHTDGSPFRWGEAARMMVIGLPSCWLAVGLPPRMLPAIRAELRVPAS